MAALQEFIFFFSLMHFEKKLEMNTKMYSLY